FHLEILTFCPAELKFVSPGLQSLRKTIFFAPTLRNIINAIRNTDRYTFGFQRRIYQKQGSSSICFSFPYQVISFSDDENFCPFWINKIHRIIADGRQSIFFIFLRFILILALLFLS